MPKNGKAKISYPSKPQPVIPPEAYILGPEIFTSQIPAANSRDADLTSLCIPAARFLLFGMHTKSRWVCAKEIVRAHNEKEGTEGMLNWDYLLYYALGQDVFTPCGCVLENVHTTGI